MDEDDGAAIAVLRIMGDNTDDSLDGILGVNHSLIWSKAVCKSSLAIKLNIVLAGGRFKLLLGSPPVSNKSLVWRVA